MQVGNRGPNRPDLGLTRALRIPQFTMNDVRDSGPATTAVFLPEIGGAGTPSSEFFVANLPLVSEGSHETVEVVMLSGVEHLIGRSGRHGLRLLLRHLLLELLGREADDVLILVAVDVVGPCIEILEHDLARQHLALPFDVLALSSVELEHDLAGEEL